MPTDVNKRNQELITLFGKKCCEIRKSKGITLVQLEQRIGIRNGDLSRIENGKVDVGLTTIAKLAEGLGVAMKKLVDI
ncbi:helix-turn-helix domain-containing protein [Chitinophaga lutea]